MYKVWVLVFGLMLNASIVEAKNRYQIDDQKNFQVADDQEDRYPISPSDAANIAKDANPGAKVLNVKLLPSGVYAVTLRQGGNVSRVMVDATNGSTS